MSLPQSAPRYKPKRSPVHASVRPVSRPSGSLTSLASQVEEGLLLFSPVPSDDGINGTQLFRSKAGDFAAVFKAEGCNDHDDGDSPRPSIDHCLTPHEQSIREVAAHVIDRRGFFGVPTTGLVDISYSGFHSGQIVSESPVVVRKRTGSLQEFARSDGSAEDMSVSRFPTSAVHRLAILDIMLLNGDRHEGNVLVQRKEKGCKLIPIDHAYCLPRTLDKCWFCWLTWPQAKIPFASEELDYIASIDVEKDVRALRRLDVTEDALDNFRLACTLLKRGAESGMTAYDIGAVMCRVRGAHVESELETVLAQSKSVSSRMTEKADKSHILHDMIYEMLAARTRSAERRKGINAGGKTLLRVNLAEDRQIAMSQYPVLSTKCGDLMRLGNSPLVMHRI